MSVSLCVSWAPEIIFVCDTYPDEKKKVGEGSDAKSQCGYEHEHSDEYLAPGLCTRNLTDPKYEAAEKNISSLIVGGCS